VDCVSACLLQRCIRCMKREAMFVTKVYEEATCVCVWMCMQVCGTM
jgi:hypothetical protein